MKINEDFTQRSKLCDLGRWYVTEFVRSVAARLPAGSRLLDAGAGECTYKRFFAHCRYVAMDFGMGETGWNYSNLDAFARLDALPVREGSMDAVLCTQVLEHLDRPWRALPQMYLALKPGGALYLTAPMASPEHQAPHDFFRYTSYGLRSLCRDAGFQDPRIEALGGFPARLAYEIPRLLSLFPGSGLKSGRVRPGGVLMLPARTAAIVAVRGLQRLLLWADRFDRERIDPFGWSVVATKA